MANGGWISHHPGTSVPPLLGQEGKLLGRGMSGVRGRRHYIKSWTVRSIPRS
jgi:hypothetical protein